MKKITCILIMCLLIINSEAQNVPINILPLGNSITAAINVGYREKLYASLNAANINFQYVGKFGDDPFKHSGVSSYTSGMILKDLDVLTQDYAFNYVLLHIGTNDIHWPDIDINTTTKNNINQIIVKLKAKNPKVVIFLAQIIPSLDANYPNEKIKELNKIIKKLADEQINKGVHIVVVDHYTAFLKPNLQPDETLFQDGVHPNDAGYSVMANTWFQAIDGITRGLTKGAGEQKLGKGEKTNVVTDENVWRWSEYYYGYLDIANIVEDTDLCGAKHTYVFGEVDGATVEYRMKFGGDHSMLVLRGKADDPAPIKMEIYVDAELKATATWDNGDNCNEETTVYIPDVDYGTHYIAVKYIKDSPDPVGNYQRFYFDGLKVIRATYTGDLPSLRKQHVLPTWVDDAKLGLSIHWGVYSVPAYAPKNAGSIESYAEWYWYWYEKNKKVNPDTPYHPDIAQQQKSYNQFIDEWQAESYDPVKWAEFAKEMGAQYIFITSKHHDGFCLWPTETTNRNSVKYGPKKDIIGLFVKAARDVGLKVGFYYSLYEWFNPDYLSDCDKNCVNCNLCANCPAEEQQKCWDNCSSKKIPFPANVGYNDYKGIKPLISGENYVDHYMIPQIKELIDWYHPDLLYFDGEDAFCNGPWDCNRTQEFWKMDEVVAYYYNQAEVRGQEVYVNDRLGGKRELVGDIFNDEPGTGANIKKLEAKWSYWHGITNTFGHNRKIDQTDFVNNQDKFLNSKHLIEKLVQAVSTNGNFDLNVGPKASGEITDYERDTLKLLGNWLKVNGEAIYGTRFWYKKQKDTYADAYFTIKGDTLYAIFTNWNSNEFKLKDIKPIEGSSIKLLGVQENLEWTWNLIDGLTIKYPVGKQYPNDKALSFKICIGAREALGEQVVYFNDGSLDSKTTLVHPVVFSTLDQIDYDWPEGTPDIKIGSRISGENNFSARFQGTIKVKEDGEYDFRIIADQGVRLWINVSKPPIPEWYFSLVIDRWEENPANSIAEPFYSVELKEGKEYPFRLEYFHHGDATVKNAMLHLEWKEKTKDKWETVPSEAIGPPINMPTIYGLQGSYYNDRTTPGFESLVRTDQQINFNWDNYSPHPRIDNDGYFVVVWEGKIKAFYDGLMKFYTEFNPEIESMSLWFNGSPVTKAEGKDYTVGMEAGKLYDIKIQYKKTSNQPSSGIKFEWESVDSGEQCRQIVPPYCLFPPDNPKWETPLETPVTGLLGKYYNIKSSSVGESFWPGWPEENAYPDPSIFFPADGNQALESPVSEHVDFINFNWGAGSPDYRIGADYFISQWEGYITLPEDENEGERQFEWTTDDGGTLIIGGNTIINTWENRNNPKIGKFTMKQNEKYPFYARHFERGGSASGGAVLKWAKLSTNNAALKSTNTDTERGSVVYEVVPPEAFTSINMPANDGKTIACKTELLTPTPPVVTDICGKLLTPTGPVISPVPECEGIVTYVWTYTDCAGKTYDWKYAVTVEYEDFQMPLDEIKTISTAGDIYTPTAPVVYDNCGKLLKPTGPVINTESGRVKYVWTYTDCEGNSHDWAFNFSIINSGSANFGNTNIYSLASLSTVRRAMPVTFSEASQIQSISVYHNAGSGNVILGVYSDVAGLPSALLGVTPSTAVRSTAGWQTVTLTTPVNVTSGQKVWLAWVFQNVSNIRYERTSAPASVSSSGTWSSGMPSAFGTSYKGNFKFSVYCFYTTNVVSDATKPIVTAFTIPATSASLIVPVSNFTATDNKAVTGFKLTETSTAPLASDAGWTTVAPTSYTFATEGTKTLYAWAKDGAGNVSESVSAQVEILTKIGNTQTFGLASLSKVRRAIPVTFNEAGQIQSISVYHNAGSGNVILGVYSEVAGLPSALLGVTPSTAVRTTAGWQTVTLITPVNVTSGQKIWLAWVFQNVSNIRYERTSAPASVSSSGTWSSGIPSAFGTSYNGNFKFSVYCSYTTNVVSDVTKPIVTAFTIPATSASLIVPVSNFTATDNKAVTGFKLTETSAAPLAGDAGWTTVAPTSYTFATKGTKILYAWAKDKAGNVSESVSAQVEIPTKIGNTETFGLASLSTVRRAMPVTFNEAGQIQSISVYHNAGSGNVILGVYSDAGVKPSALLGVTPSTAVKTTAGWQTVTLTAPVGVTSGQKVWLAWVFQNVSNIRYERTSTPASVSSSGTWSSGMPSAFGKSYNGNFKFSVYCTYTTDAVPDATKPIVTAFTIPATSASLIVPVSNFTATDNKTVTGFKLTETSAAPLVGDAGWTTVAPTSYTFATVGTKTLYAWAKDAAGNVSESASAQVVIPTKIGNTQTFSLASLSTVRRAIPVTFNEAGQIQSISVYHNAGSGNVILGVYSDVAGLPSALLGVTPSTAVRTTTGWQTVTLITPVNVTSGQKIWLAWVFQNVSNIRYERTSAPASVSSSGTWSSGMPSAFGKSYNGNFKFSVYCTYIVDNTKSVIIAGEIEPVFEKADLKVYPNPFSDKLYFEFFTTDDTYAVLEIYNLLGQSIERLLDQKVEGGVMNRIEYTPKQIISGFYIYKFTLDGKSSFGKVIYKK